LLTWHRKSDKVVGTLAVETLELQASYKITPCVDKI
jgi:hypothetical protein